MDKNINNDEEKKEEDLVKEEDLADVLGGVPFDVALDRALNGDSKNYSNLSIDELRAEKRRLEALKAIAVNKFVLHNHNNLRGGK